MKRNESIRTVMTREVVTVQLGEAPSDLMRAEPKTVVDTATVRDAAKGLAHGEYHSLPVVDGEGALVGIATSTDLIGYLLEQY